MDKLISREAAIAWYLNGIEDRIDEIFKENDEWRKNGYMELTVLAKELYKTHPEFVELAWPCELFENSTESEKFGIKFERGYKIGASDGWSSVDIEYSIITEETDE